MYRLQLLLQRLQALVTIGNVALQPGDTAERGTMQLLAGSDRCLSLRQLGAQFIDSRLHSLKLCLHQCLRGLGCGTCGRDLRTRAGRLRLRQRQLRRQALQPGITLIKLLFALTQHRIEQVAAPFKVLQRFVVCGRAAPQFDQIVLCAQQRTLTQAALALPIALLRGLNCGLLFTQNVGVVQFGLNTLEAQAQIIALGLAQAMLLDTGRQISFQRADARQIFTAPFAPFTVNQWQPQDFFSSLASAHVRCDRGIA